ncbi:iron-containing alcohol dehydrogenase, partial [Pseudomonas sp. SIMBA_044]|uniref:iron-containing alcohol dehydrogenase n=1 Tax=Pseudomonas sp. SIMBA_044 TaxID=3085785 RepID=UPI00397B49DF
MQFQVLLPTKIVMEPGLRQRTGEHLRGLGLSHVLLVTDPGVKNAGLLDSIYTSLEQAGVRYEEIADVKPN